MNSDSLIYWNRIGYVAIEDRDGRMVKYGGRDSGLDFKFSGEITGNIYNTFTVGILGLTLDTINQLTVWNPIEVYGKKRRIQVYAGYDYIEFGYDAINNPIFEGIIIEAIPSNPPEMWLNFKCMINSGNGGPITSYYDATYVNRRTLGEIWDDIAEINGYSGARWESKRLNKNKSVIFKFYSMSQNELVNEFTNRFNVIGLNIDNVLVCRDKKSWADPKNPKEIVSTETGLIGIAGVSVKGAVIRRRLSDTVACSDSIYLKSEVIPKVNGLYTILKKKHVGHFRGNDWYTELELIRAEVK